MAKSKSARTNQLEKTVLSPLEKLADEILLLSQAIEVISQAVDNGYEENPLLEAACDDSMLH